MEDIKVLKDTTEPDGTRIIYAEPNGVCSRQIGIAVKDGKIVEAAFMGGCAGNTQGVCRLVAGMRVEEAISRIKGIDCGGKGTSCPDQLARALEKFI